MEKYLTVGTNTIYESLLLPIHNSSDPHNIKPTGGLWFTLYDENYPNFNEWLDYLTWKTDLLYFMNHGQNPHQKPGTVITLKEDAKIYHLETAKELEYLMEHYPRELGYFDYEALSKDFDGIFVKPNRLNVELMEAKIKGVSFDPFSVNTLLLFNTNVIKTCQSAEIEITPYWECDNEFFDYTINVDSTIGHVVTNEEEKNRILDSLFKKIKDYLNNKGIKFSELTPLELNDLISETLEHFKNEVHEANKVGITYKSLYRKISRQIKKP